VKAKLAGDPVVLPLAQAVLRCCQGRGELHPCKGSPAARRGNNPEKSTTGICMLPARICLRLSLAGGWCQITRGSCGLASQCDMTGRMAGWLSRRCRCPSHTALFTDCDADLIH